MPVIGSVNARKDDSNKLVLKINLEEGKTLTLKNGDAIFLDTTVEHYGALVERGYIGQDEADARIKKTPDFVKRLASVKKENIG